MSDVEPDEHGAGEQLELLRSSVRGRRPRPVEGAAAVDPVARVVLDVPLPHLDRLFDYLVPESMAETAVPGARCVVRFAGAEATGYVVERAADTDHVGALSPLRRVPSAEPVLDPEVLRAARAVADACAGTLADVLRLAVPPRHGATEKRAPGAEPIPLPAPDPEAWGTYRGGEAFLSRVADGQAPRAVWTALPGEPGWPHELAVAAATAASAGRGALVVVPDGRDVDRVASALGALGAADHTVRLSADLGAGPRYAAFLAARRGTARIVVGTRSAVLAPVRDLGLVVCWDDGDDLHAEPRAPYPHSRDVLRVRAEQAGAAALFGGLSRSVDAEQLVASGWARSVHADRAQVRRRVPRVVVSGDDDLRDPAARTARIPSLALRTARTALETGPVLVQVPRAGYVPALACQTCRAPARCATCHGPLGLPSGSSQPTCGWCARIASGWACRVCDGRRWRSVTVGAARTAEELGRALPGVPVRTSGRDGGVLAQVPGTPALVLATPGAEPVAEGGYTAALLLDAWAPLSRPDLRASEEALRRWTAAAALVRPDGEGGRVVIVGEASLPAVQALVRWDHAGHAGRELAERVELGLPPAAVMAEVVGLPDGVAALRAALRLPDGAEVLGPVPVEDGRQTGEEQQRLLVRSPLATAPAVARALAAARSVLSAAKTARPPRVRMAAEEIG